MKRSARGKVRRPWGRIALGTVAGVVLATSAFLQSLSNLTEEGSPVLAAKVWPDNDRALARVASLQLAASQTAAAMMQSGEAALDSAAVDEDLSGVREFALRALAASPLNSAAFRNLAYLALIKQDEVQALAYARTAESLSRRDAAAQLLLTRAALLESDFATALAHFDVALRTSNSANREMFPLLASALTSDEIRTSFRPYMRSDNPWLTDFLLFAIESAPAPAVVGRLVADAPALPERPGASLQEIAVLRMVQVNEPALARRIAMQVPEEQRPAADGGLSNSSLSLAAGIVQPFDWVPANDGTLNFSDLTDGISVTSEYSYRGELLRQMTTLSPGAYQLRYSGALSPGVGWTVTCTGTGEQLVAGSAATTAGFTVPEGCDGQWVRLNAQGTAPVNAEISEVTIATAN